MKKSAVTANQSAIVTAPAGDSLAPLIEDVRKLIQAARHSAVTTVNTLQVLTNFEIGRRIVEQEQNGESRAEYGRELLKSLSMRLTEEFGRGFSEDNLARMRNFYVGWKDRPLEFPRSLRGNLPSEAKHHSAGSGISINMVRNPTLKSTVSFTLSSSHYVLLLTIKDLEERNFYEIETASQGWSIPELKRQVASCLYERLALSRDKDEVRKLAAEGQIVTKPEDVIKEPHVLEFLGLNEKAEYSETDLETAIINRLEHFLLELGKGFLFEARQKRFTFEEDHFFVDQVFYNRLLRCYVLIDLKLDKLSHQDLGQMQMYVNYFDRNVRLPTENPTVGILLCKRKKDAIVEQTLPPDDNIHAKEYKLYLPSKEELRQKLLEWAQD